MLCRGNSIKSKRGSVGVYLNVYDLTPMNGYAYWLGLGAYHSGVQVHGVEYAFGAHEYPTTGIFEAEPKHCDGFTFRKSILIGWTDLKLNEVRMMMEELAQVYKGNAYNLMSKNCNHFCNDACVRLTGNSIPNWVNRLARIGLFCNCIVPASLNSRKVGDHRIEDKVCEGGEKKKPSNRSNRFTPSSNSSSSSSSSPPLTTTTNTGSRVSLPQSSPSILAASSS